MSAPRVVALIGADLNLRARVMGGQSKGMGTQLTHSAARASGRTGRHLHGAQQRRRTHPLTAFRRVADYPLDVTVGTSLEDALAAWRNTRSVMLTLTAVLSGVVLVATVSFVIGLRRLERTNDALR
jgi:hypothetical protein